jgi:hypothetical protein
MQNCLSIDNWLNPRGWRPFRTNLLVFSSQADFQLIFNCPNCLQDNSSAWTTQKTHVFPLL